MDKLAAMDRSLAQTFLTESASRRMQVALDDARKVAPTSATVLLTGETGVGKGVFARLIHSWSDRSAHPFVVAHCGAIPETLLESELFGHEKGAFTGADRRRIGKFEQADGGCLFLDEIGTTSPAVQVKLLNVLQERRIQRVGGEQEISIDLRIIAATNESLHDASLVRADLFHRLNVFPIEIPPLRERREDLPELVAHLIAKLNARYTKVIDGLEPAVEDAFLRYPWPGNVRELENVLERAHILESTSSLSAQHIPFEVLNSSETHAAVAVPVGGDRTLAEVRAEAVDAAERRYLLELLATHEGRMEASAEVAGITSRQLRNLLVKHGIEKSSFKRKR